MFVRNLLYGLGLGLLLVFIKVTEYNFFAGQVSLHAYLGGLAFFFLVMGFWLGLVWKKKQGDQPSTFSVKGNSLLSDRENEVLLGIARGQSNREIADALFVSTNTVKTHISNIYTKLGVKRRTQAIAKAKSLALLGD